jgi:hypothetical protein
MTFRTRVKLGRTGLEVSRPGIASGYGVPARAIERAFHEHGLNYFYPSLLKKKRMPSGEPPLSSTDCYRFVLSNPGIDVCIVGAGENDGGLWIHLDGPGEGVVPEEGDQVLLRPYGHPLVEAVEGVGRHHVRGDMHGLFFRWIVDAPGEGQSDGQAAGRRDFRLRQLAAGPLEN